MGISRRDAIGRMGAALAGTSSLAVLANHVKTTGQIADQAGRKGNIKHSVTRWPYGSYSLEDLCIASKEIGIDSIELVGPDDWPTLHEHGLHCAMANGAEPGIDIGFNDPGLHADLRRSYENVIPQVADAGFTNLICFSGNRNGLDDETGLKNCEEGLRPLVKLAEEHGVVLCMELFNSKIDHPDYQADSSQWGVELCDRIGSESFKLLYDIYHMQIMEGDIIRTIRDYGQYFAHYHTGGVPGRNEIDETQELYYPAVMRAIADSGYEGYVGQEFIPSRDDDLESLRQGVEICDV